MKLPRIPRWLQNIGLGLAIIVLLAMWIALPWQGVALVVIGLVIWLITTRGGRLAWMATRLGLSSLPQRWGASLVIVVGIAGVVGVLVAMLAMGEGFSATLKGTGSDRNAILLRGGAQAETNSVITRDQAVLVQSLPGIARDGDSLLCLACWSARWWATAAGASSSPGGSSFPAPSDARA